MRVELRYLLTTIQKITFTYPFGVRKARRVNKTSVADSRFAKVICTNGSLPPHALLYP